MVTYGHDASAILACYDLFHHPTALGDTSECVVPMFVVLGRLSACCRSLRALFADMVPNVDVDVLMPRSSTHRSYVLVDNLQEADRRFRYT